MKQDFKVFRLAGKSLNAAKIIYDTSRAEIRSRADVPAYRKKYEDQLKAIGVASRSVHVEIQDGAFPRAYESVPACYIGITKDFTVYMYAPVDYRGRFFTPEDAVPLDEKESNAVGYGLWAGGWTTPEMLIPTPYLKGVSLPADFSAAADRTVPVAPRFDRDATTAFFQGISRLKQHFCDGRFIKTYSEPDQITLIPALRSDENRRPLLVLSAYDQKAMKRASIQSNGWLTAKPLGNDEYLITPNMKTAGGMVLQDALNRIPDLPGPETLWKMQDESDRRRFASPPPPPRELLHLSAAAAWPFPKSAPAP